MKGLLHFILMGVITICLTGCIMDDVEPEVAMVDVSINVSLADAVPSRAYEDAQNGNEMMHTLRVVIVRNEPDGLVEHNRFIDLTRPLTRYGLETFEVFANENKYIYFFVNEESTKFDVTDGFSFKDDIEVGKAFPYNKLKKAKITLGVNENGGNITVQQMPMPLPMNSMYSLQVGNLSLSKTFWVTRAATKFTYIIKNLTSKDYQLSRLEIKEQAVTEHYMQHLNGNIAEWSTENDDILNGKDADGYNKYNTPLTGTETNFYPYVQDFTNAVNVPAGGQVQLAPIYLAETKKFNDNDYWGDDKFYQTTLSFGTLASFTGMLDDDLPHQLPRNTHVVVTVNINQKEVNWEVDVFPYTGVLLEPDFGL